MTVQIQPPVAATARKPLPRTQASPPPLNTGDRLSRAEFERRYHAHSEIKKAELVEGIVYMPSPARFAQHSQPHAHMVAWLGLYCSATPGVLLGDNATTRLDYENVVQPDALLRLDPMLGGRSSVTTDDYLSGPPELVVEIAASSVSYDLGVKRRVYARSGVQEYLTAQAYEQRVDWFVLREGEYETLQPDQDGILRSEAFPGLWLPVDALWAGDLTGMIAVLTQGLSSLEHAAFVTDLRGRIG